MNLSQYQTFTRVAKPLLMAKLMLRGRRIPAYRHNMRQRFGDLSKLENQFQTSSPRVWFHAVSVGETIAAEPLVRALMKERPDVQVHISSTTPTGAAEVERRFGDAVTRAFVPWDSVPAVNAYLDALKPDVLVLIETELWPVLIDVCYSRGIPVVLANGRLSEKSAKGYQKMGRLARDACNQLAHILVQYPADAARFQQILGPRGRPPEVCGSSKNDVSLTHYVRGEMADRRSSWGWEQAPVWIAASTHPSEEVLMLKLHARLLKITPNAKLILAPRHPERVTSVMSIIETHGLGFQRFSDLKTEPKKVPQPLVLVDTLGELLRLYGVADVAVMGGTFAAKGGHNFIEPALWGVPVIAGTSLFNFETLAAHLIDVGALKSVPSASECYRALEAWLTDADARQAAGDAGRTFVERQRGATAQQLNFLMPLLPAPASGAGN